jgi:hypothetical protein
MRLHFVKEYLRERAIGWQLMCNGFGIGIGWIKRFKRDRPFVGLELVQ